MKNISLSELKLKYSDMPMIGFGVHENGIDYITIGIIHDEDFDGWNICTSEWNTVELEHPPFHSPKVGDVLSSVEEHIIELDEERNLIIIKFGDFYTENGE